MSPRITGRFVAVIPRESGERSASCSNWHCMHGEYDRSSRLYRTTKTRTLLFALATSSQPWAQRSAVGNGRIGRKSTSYMRGLDGRVDDWDTEPESDG